ncbi:MAG: hypothetical protein AAB553_00915 [Patescibacteria group bacterium]
MRKASHYETMRALTAFFVVVIAFAIFLLFYLNSESILSSQDFYPFMTLAVVGMGLLLWLFYIVSNQPHLHKKSLTKTKIAKKSPKKKKK